MKRILDWLIPDASLASIGRTCGAFMDGLLAPIQFELIEWRGECGRRMQRPVLKSLTVEEAMRPLFVQWGEL